MRKEPAWERAFREVWRREQWFFRRYAEKPDRALVRKASALTPAQLEETLHSAFIQGFRLVFEKGTGAIRWAGREKARRAAFGRNLAAVEEEEDRRSLRAFSRAARRSGWGNLAVSGTAGVGMGLFGVALPDIPLLSAMLLKSVYETAESFGFPCEGPAEQLYALRILETALSYGPELRRRSRSLDVYAQDGFWGDRRGVEEQLRSTARRLSEEILYDKALQSIPVAGAAGGLSDAAVLRRIQSFAAIKYEKRFLISRRAGE